MFSKVINNNTDLPNDKFAEIHNLYRNKLKIPQNKPPRQFLLCPVGLLGAGKTTVMKLLVEELNVVRVSTDEIREILKENNFNYDRTYDIAYKIIEELLNQSHSVAIDGNCGSKRAIEKIEEWEELKGLLPIWLHINPPEEFIINKLKNYSPTPTWLFQSSDEAVKSFNEYKEKYGNFKNLNLPYTYVFDTSKDNLKEQMKQAVNVIKAKLEKSL